MTDQSSELDFDSALEALIKRYGDLPSHRLIAALEQAIWDIKMSEVDPEQLSPESKPDEIED